jgi:tetratricopeptide (TPR) repeat protein
VAIDFLDEAVALAPDNAESWNRRAALHVLNNDYNRAVYDINRALELEPRHFGALAGFAGILQERGQKAAALKVYERVLTLYPMMREAQQQVQLLSEELSDIHT